MPNLALGGYVAGPALAICLALCSCSSNPESMAVENDSITVDDMNAMAVDDADNMMMDNADSAVDSGMSNSADAGTNDQAPIETSPPPPSSPKPEPKPAPAQPSADDAACQRAGVEPSTPACKQIILEAEQVGEGVAAFTPPQRMIRGQTAKVRLALAAGKSQSIANDLIAKPTDKVVEIADAKFGRVMEARLSGDGFNIEPAGRIRQNVGQSDRTAWEWQVTPTRAASHNLRVEAWVMVTTPDGIKEASYRAIPPTTVDVPVRFYPEETSDFFDDSSAWLAKGTNWLKALLAFVVAAGAVWAAIRTFGKPTPPKAS